MTQTQHGYLPQKGYQPNYESGLGNTWFVYNEATNHARANLQNLTNNIDYGGKD